MRFFTNLRSTHATKTLCVISIFLFAGIVMAKEFWETKTFDQWTQRECQRVLTDSPWVRELELTGGFGGSSISATDSRQPFVKYNIQLRSAAPVRQAIVRQAQINKQYDSLSAEQKQAFDQNMQDFLVGASPEFVVVNISFEANDQNFIRDLNRHWETQTTDLLRNSVFIRGGSRGNPVPIVQFIPGSGASQEFQFVFPREVNGENIIKPNDRVLQLEFAYPVIGRLGDGRGLIEFRTDRMRINNEVIY